MAKTYVLTKDFCGQVQALVVKEAVDATSYVLHPLTEEFFLKASGSGPTLQRFNSAADAKHVADSIDADIAAGHAGSGSHLFAYGTPKSNYQGLTPTELNLSIELIPHGQMKLV